MPRFNMTGPMGDGPFTGRGMGYCAQRNVRPVAYGRGGGRGMGRSRGMGFRRGPKLDPNYYDGPVKSEKELLEDEKAYLEKQLNSIKNTLSKLDNA